MSLDSPVFHTKESVKLPFNAKVPYLLKKVPYLLKKVPLPVDSCKILLAVTTVWNTGETDDINISFSSISY